MVLSLQFTIDLQTTFGKTSILARGQKVSWAVMSAWMKQNEVMFIVAQEEEVEQSLLNQEHINHFEHLGYDLKF